MGADDAVDSSGGEFGEEFADFLVWDEATDLSDCNGIGSHPFAEGIKVLLAEDGGGNQDGSLFAGEDCFEHCANGDFGFTEANVTANEAIHGMGGFHFCLGCFNGGELVGGFFKREGVFEFFLPEMVFGESETFGLVTFGVEAEEFGGVIKGGGFGGSSGFSPGFSSDFAEFWGGLGEAKVAGKEV